jgi:hypothetical protein
MSNPDASPESARLAAMEARLAATEARLAATEARLAAVERRPAPVQKPAPAQKPARVRRQAPPRFSSTATKVLSTLAALGGAATVAQLRKQLPECAHSSIRRTCQELRDGGQLRHTAHGTYEVVAAE